MIERIELGDAFGNSVPNADHYGRIIPIGDRYMTRADDGVALIAGAIWPDETWNVRAVFNRWGAESFDPAHCWTASIKLPGAGEKVSLNLTGRVQECEIGLHSIEAPKADPSPSESTASVRIGSSATTISLTFVGKEKGSRWEVLSLKDQHGFKLLSGFDGAIHSPPRMIKLYPRQDSGEVKIIFGVSNPVTVELSGRPTILRENVARWAAKQ